jgi:hypothetical protein
VISRTDAKKKDVLALGADADWHVKHIGTLDLIINTSSSEKSPMMEYILMLKAHSTLV